MREWLVRIVSSILAHPYWTSLAFGALTAVGFPPIGSWPIALAALAAFIALLLKTPSVKSSVTMGWLFGWAHLTLANNWIATAFTYQAEMPQFLGWIAVPLLCVYLAIYPAIAAGFAKALSRKDGSIAFGLVFAAAWIATEWLRSWVFTGYPWPPLGLILLGDWSKPGIAIVLPWLGTYALSGLAIVTAVLIASAALSKKWVALAAVAVSTSAAMLFPLASVQEREDTEISYALVQPLLLQDEINDPTKFEAQFETIARLTLPGREQSRLVLWPESAVPDYLEDGYPQRFYDRMTAAGDPEFARKRIGSIIGSDSSLLTGVVNLDFEEKNGFMRAVSARNSVIAINGAGEIGAQYAKAHLVPYGEYLPMRGILEPLGLSRLVAGSIDYKPGPGPGTIDLGEHGRAGIQICYEIVFSGQTVDQANRPDYIFNPSNDGWFGAWGPPQHLAQARLRAIEEGLPVLRSTTTGISAVIDADGIVRHSIASGEADRIDGFVPVAKQPTPFSRLGNGLALAWALVLFLVGLLMPRLVAQLKSRR